MCEGSYSANNSIDDRRLAPAMYHNILSKSGGGGGGGAFPPAPLFLYTPMKGQRF